MTDGALVQRLARVDGTLLKPDRPMTPVDAMFGTLAGAARGQPDYAKGARLWATHATVAPEDAALAPELATAPTRRLVSHSAVDATLHQTVPTALAALHDYHLQYIVVAVNNTSPWKLSAGDLYPAPPTGAQLFYRSTQAPHCVQGTDPVAQGCLTPAAAAGELMDTSANALPCRSPGHCVQNLGVWQVSAAVGEGSRPTVLTFH